MLKKTLSPSHSPSPLLPHSSLSILSSLAAVSANELSSNVHSRSPSPSPSPSVVNVDTFIHEAGEIIARGGKSERTALRNKLRDCANRFIQWNLEQVQVTLNNNSVCDQIPLFIATIAEQLAQSDQCNTNFKAQLLNRAIFDYVYGNDLESARDCIAQLVETNQYKFVCGVAENFFKEKKNPIYCAVLYEASALMLLNRPEHRKDLEQTERQDLIYQNYLQALFHAALGQKSTYAKHIAYLYLEKMDIAYLLSEAENTYCNTHLPLYNAIMYDLIISKLLSNRPSIDDKLIGYFKSAIRLYAKAGEIDLLKATISEYKRFYEGAASVLMQAPDNEIELDKNARESQMTRLNQLIVFSYIVDKEFSYAKQYANSYLKSSDLKSLLYEASDKLNNAENPLYCAIMYDLIISKLLSNKPSSDDRGVIKRHNDKLILYFKSAIHLYARANDIDQLKMTLSAYQSFDVSGRLFTILKNETGVGAEMAVISRALETGHDSENTENAPAMRC